MAQGNYAGGPPTRLYNGVGTAKVIEALGMFPLPNPMHVYHYDNDFTTYLASDWTVTAGGGGSGVALGAGVGGQLAITAATSGVEAITGGLNTNFTNATSNASGLKTWFRARVLLDATVANPDYQIGLTNACATFNGCTDGVYFTKATTATAWSFVIRGASTSTTVALPTAGTGVPTSSTWVDMAYYFDGKGMFFIYFGNILIGTYGTSPNGAVGSLGSSLANLPLATVFLGPTFLNAFHTGTSLLTVDHVLASCEVAR
jgi:hypothetical protein